MHSMNTGQNIQQSSMMNRQMMEQHPQMMNQSVSSVLLQRIVFPHFKFPTKKCIASVSAHVDGFESTCFLQKIDLEKL